MSVKSWDFSHQEQIQKIKLFRFYTEKEKKIWTELSSLGQTPTFNSLTTKKQNDKIFVCKFSKNVKSKLHVYHVENSKTRGQTV